MHKIRDNMSVTMTTAELLEELLSRSDLKDALKTIINEDNDEYDELLKRSQVIKQIIIKITFHI